MNVTDIIAKSGGPYRLARALGINHSAVLRWTRVPPGRAHAVARIAEISLHDINDELWPIDGHVEQESA